MTSPLGSASIFESLQPVSRDEYDQGFIKQRLHDTALGADWQRFGRTRRVLAKTALSLFVGGTIIGGAYTSDVVEAKSHLDKTHPVIEIISPANDKNDAHRVTIGIGGFGTTSAESAMHALQYESIGMEATLEYDKKGIDTTVIKNEILKFAKQHHIDQILFSGHSMGGDVALEVASLLHEDPDAPEVSDIILDCTPPNLSALQPDTRRAGDSMMSAISHVPGHRSSRYLRGIGEMISRNDRYLNKEHTYKGLVPYVNIRDFERELESVKRTKLSYDAGSIGLVEDQYRQIVADGAEQSFKRLSKSVSNKRIPKVYFLRPRDASADHVVRVDQAAKIFLELGEKYHIPVFIDELADGTGHANPGQAPKQYNELLTSIVLPQIKAAYEVYATYLQTGDKILDESTDDQPKDYK